MKISYRTINKDLKKKEMNRMLKMVCTAVHKPINVKSFKLLFCTSYALNSIKCTVYRL